MRLGATAFFLSVLGCACLHAEPLIIPVAGRGWQITFEGPVPVMESLQPDAEGLTYRASAGRFNLSVFVEAPAGSGGDSKACRDHFWSQASQNPMIRKDSVKQWITQACEFVEYEVAGDKKEEKSTQANINCCFAHEGRWVEVHASFASATDAERWMLKDLALSLAYGPFPEWKGGPCSLALGDLGRLQIEVPAGWRVGHTNVTKMAGMPNQQTLSFFSASDPNKTWKMTFFKSAVRYKTLEKIEQMAKSAQRSAADDSVEQAMNLQEIKLKQGVGCQAIYTDAALADKPVEVGNPKVISSGFVAPVPEVLGTITIFADDAKDPDFLAAIQALSSMEWEKAK